MINFRIKKPSLRSHPDFTIRHAHLSRVSEGDLKYLRSVSDFCISQVNGGVREVGIDKGSQYFIEDHTKEKSVRSVFESHDFEENDIGAIRGLVSFSREDIVTIYSDK